MCPKHFKDFHKSITIKLYIKQHFKATSRRQQNESLAFVTQNVTCASSSKKTNFNLLFVLLVS